jgi:cyclic pyranopterin phosphate synthase
MRVRSLLDAGLDRINVTFHGFSRSAFAERVPNAAAWDRRARFVDAVLSTKRPVKVNYVYRGSNDHDDLSALLEWAKHTHAIVGLLDELQSDLGYEGVARVLRALRGAPRTIETTPDPHSLATELWHFHDGLRVELKHQRLGEIEPYRACVQCPVRARCKEGIFALRLTHRGEIVPCLDRPELAFALTELLDALGPGGERTVATWLAHAIESGFTALPAGSIADASTTTNIEVFR